MHPRRYEKTWRDLNPEGAKGEARSFPTRAQFSAENLLRRSRDAMTAVMGLARAQAAVMREIQQINDEARVLVRTAQAECAREKSTDTDGP